MAAAARTALTCDASWRKNQVTLSVRVTAPTGTGVSTYISVCADVDYSNPDFALNKFVTRFHSRHVTSQLGPGNGDRRGSGYRQTTHCRSGQSPAG